MKTWTIIGLEGLSDDFGYSEPEAAADAIRRRQMHEDLSPQDIEDIAYRFHCRIKWEDTDDIPLETTE